jgi:hypothetical protein
MVVDKPPPLEMTPVDLPPEIVAALAPLVLGLQSQQLRLVHDRSLRGG